MAKFQDADGRTWLVEFDGLIIGRIRETHALDLLDVNAYLEELVDPPRLVTILLELLAGQIEQTGITRSEFSRAMRGNALREATLACWEALAELVPTERAALVREAIAKIKEADEQATAIAARDRNPQADRG